MEFRRVLFRSADSISLSDLMARKLLVYPSQPRPSYADQVLTILRDHGLTHTDVEEVRDVQVTLGLVASEAGVALVPSSLRHVRSAERRVGKECVRTCRCRWPP